MIDNTRALASLSRVCATYTMPRGRAHKAAIQLQQDIAAALDVWRAIRYVHGAMVVRVPAEHISSIDSLYVTVIPAEAA